MAQSVSPRKPHLNRQKVEQFVRQLKISDIRNDPNYAQLRDILRDGHCTGAHGQGLKADQIKQIFKALGIPHSGSVTKAFGCKWLHYIFLDQVIDDSKGSESEIHPNAIPIVEHLVAKKHAHLTNLIASNQLSPRQQEMLRLQIEKINESPISNQSNVLYAEQLYQERRPTSIPYDVLKGICASIGLTLTVNTPYGRVKLLKKALCLKLALYFEQDDEFHTCMNAQATNDLFQQLYSPDMFDTSYSSNPSNSSHLRHKKNV